MEKIKAFAVYVLVVLSIWGAATLFASKVSDYEVINPEENVRCVVVSRMFNTSVDCWKIQP